MKKEKEEYCYGKKGGYHNKQYLYSEEQANEFKYWLQKNQASQGRGSEMAKEEVNKMVENEKWYTSKEMCEMNNVSNETLKNFNETFRGVTGYPTKLIRKVGRAHANEYSEEALKQFQLWLMKNQANQGRASEVVKQNTEEQVKLGALTSCIQLNGDMEAAQQFCDLLMANTKAVAECKALERQKQLALEEKVQLEEDISLRKQPNQVAMDLGKYASAPLVNKIAEELNIVYRSERYSGKSDRCPTDVSLHLAASMNKNWVDDYGIEHNDPQIYYLPKGVKMIEKRYIEIIDDIITWGEDNYWPSNKDKLPAYWTGPMITLYGKVRKDHKPVKNIDQK